MSQDLLDVMIKMGKQNDAWRKSSEGISAQKVRDDAHRKVKLLRRDKKEQEASQLEYDTEEVYLRAREVWIKAHPVE